jgi:hypothetical protein
MFGNSQDPEGGAVVIGQTPNTHILQDPNGTILTDPNEVLHAEYMEDSELELRHEDKTIAEKEFGYGSPEHIRAAVEYQQAIEKYRKARYFISPKIFFSHVKSQLTPIQSVKVEERMRTIKRLITHAQELNQTGAKNQYIKLLIACTRESEILSQGLNFWVSRNEVNRFINFVYQSKEDRKKVVFLKNWRDYPRIAPKDVSDKIKQLNGRKIFDELEILYLDYTADTERTETAQTKKEKDPILFGIIKEMPDRLYFITYWEDEKCDLTIEQLVESLERSEEFSFIEDAGRVSARYVKQMKKELEEYESQFRGVPGSWGTRKTSFFDKLKFWQTRK